MEKVTDIKHSGKYSIKNNPLKDNTVKYTSTFDLVQEHIYYAIEFVYASNQLVNPGQFDMYPLGGVPSGKPEYGNINFDSLKIQEWNKLSFYFKAKDSYSYWFRPFYTYAQDIIYFDDIMLIDLTEAFENGNEPTKEYLDKYLNYFDGTYTFIYK